MEAIIQAEIGNVDFFKVAEKKDILQARNALGYSVLIVTLQRDRLECFKLILEKCPELLYVQTSYPDTVLTYAAYWGKNEFVKLITGVAEKRLYRMVNAAGNSPLHLAIIQKHLDVVKTLIAADPDFDSIPKNKNGQTPQVLAVALATGFNKTDIQVQIKDFIMKKLDEKNTPPTDFEADAIDRATKGEADFFSRAQVQVCIDARDKNGNSVLSVAILNGHFECSKVILVRFPELLYLENTIEKHTPLHHAVWRGIPQIVKLLVVGADKKLFRMQNISGSTPLHMAVWKKRLEIVKILVKADPDYNQLPANNNKETPLMIAQRLASGKTDDDVAVKIRDLLMGKQTGTEDTESGTTSDVNKLVPTTRERELSIPLTHLDLYRRLVKQFGGIAPLKMDKLEVGPIGNALASFLAFVAEMQAETPASISEEKLTKWEDVYRFSTRWGLRIDWFSNRTQWFRDWMDRRSKAIYPLEDEVDRKEKLLFDLQVDLNLSKAKLENARSAYSKFDFKIIKE